MKSLPTTITVLFVLLLAAPAHAADKPIKTFILAGQSNMVGWGDSTKLPDELREGNDRVLMFDDGKWQPLRPHAPAHGGQKRVGLTEFSFGPEIAFAHEMANAWPDETIGIINSRMVILRDIEKHPANVHYNTAGQLKAGRLFAEAFLSQTGQPSKMKRAGGKTPLEVLAKMDENGDGKVAREEFLANCGLPDDLPKAVFNEFDTDGNGELVIPEYLRVCGRWARGKRPVSIPVVFRL